MLLVLSASILIILAIAVRRYRVPVKHRWRRRQARIMAVQLSGRDRLQPPQFLYARLRAMDPLGFEELLLDSFKRRGHKVIRNQRYSGDGGIDGQVVIDGAIWLIQANRYADTIRPEHAVAFEALCRSEGRRGLFIHTGRTGAQSRAAIGQGSLVQIISGRALLALLTEGLFPDTATKTSLTGKVGPSRRAV